MYHKVVNNQRNNSNKSFYILYCVFVWLSKTSQNGSLMEISKYIVSENEGFGPLDPLWISF